ncbi:serine/threonine-protein kinase HipA [Bradyrhizobium sp. Ghvi]|nr:serine/threonine-protein kinase HipA [Bradyrhizobium sp. Ghvi]
MPTGPTPVAIDPACRRGARSSHRSGLLVGLLPDNEQLLERWAKKFQVSVRNVFGLISNVGENCAGAVQFVTPDRLEALKTGKGDKIKWLDRPEIASRIRVLREDHAACRLPATRVNSVLQAPSRKPRFSSKTSTGAFRPGAYRHPHLKPATGHFDGHAVNEHTCLRLARELGLPAAETKVDRQVSGQHHPRSSGRYLPGHGHPADQEIPELGQSNACRYCRALAYLLDRPRADLPTFVSTLVLAHCRL